MRIRRSRENRIINYYKDRNKIKRLKYEIEVLENSINDLECCISHENRIDIESILKKNKRMVIDKKLKLNEMINKNMSLEAYIITMNKDDKKLCELRYAKELGYQEIGSIMHMSNSTVSRRLTSILEEVNC